MASTTAAASATCALNDRFRRTMSGGTVVFTPGAHAFGHEMSCRLLEAVAAFDAFDSDDDPHGEHDFGALSLAGERFFWKIDYYDLTMQHASPDPADPAVTERVLTVMRADEY